MNFRKREFAILRLTIERDLVCSLVAGDNLTLVAYAHKDQDIGNQLVCVETCNKATGEFWQKQFNIPANVTYILEAKEILEIEQ